MTMSKKETLPFYGSLLNVGEFSRSPSKLPLQSHKTKLVYMLIPEPVTGWGGEIMLSQFRFTQKGLQWGRDEYLKEIKICQNEEVKNGCLADNH